MQHATYILECRETRARHIAKLTSQIDYLKGIQSARKLTANEELQLHGLHNARYRLNIDDKGKLAEVESSGSCQEVLL